jgi:hypothetical protein
MFFLLCSACYVLPVMFCLLCSACYVLPVNFVCPVLVVMSRVETKMPFTILRKCVFVKILVKSSLKFHENVPKTRIAVRCSRNLAKTLGHYSWDRIAWAGLLRQVSLDKFARKVSRIMSASTRQIGEDGQNMSVRKGLGQDNWDRTTSTGQPGRDSQERRAGACQPGQVGLKSQPGAGQIGQTERTRRPACDREEMTATHPGQDRWSRTEGQDSQNLTAWT